MHVKEKPGKPLFQKVHRTDEELVTCSVTQSFLIDMEYDPKQRPGVHMSVCLSLHRML